MRRECGTLSSRTNYNDFRRDRHNILLCGIQPILCNLMKMRLDGLIADLLTAASSPKRTIHWLLVNRPSLAIVSQMADGIQHCQLA